MFEIKPETESQTKVVEFLYACAVKAERKGLKVPDMTHVDFNITSVRYAGQAGQGGVHRNTKHAFELSLHGQALEFYGFDRFRKTVVHEFCHILQFINRPGEQAHGSYFYMLMDVLGFDNLPNSYHDFDLRTLMGKKKRKQRRWEYKCDCVEPHSIATVTHNRIQKKGQIRKCLDCDMPIKWTGKEIK